MKEGTPCRIPDGSRLFTDGQIADGVWSVCKANGGHNTGFPWSISCHVPCGDGHLDAGETCDCGNGVPTCTYCSNCQLEAGAQRADQITAIFRMEFTSDPSTSQDFANIGAKSCEAFKGAHPGIFGEPECGMQFIEEIRAGKGCFVSIIDLCVAPATLKNKEGFAKPSLFPPFTHHGSPMGHTIEILPQRGVALGAGLCGICAQNTTSFFSPLT